MFRWLKQNFVSLSVGALTLIAASSIQPASWMYIYQPEVPEELLK